MKEQILRLPVVDYPADCQRIQAALLGSGIVATLPQCEQLWALHSDTLSAGWLPVDGWSADAIVEFLLPFIHLFHQGE